MQGQSLLSRSDSRSLSLSLRSLFPPKSSSWSLPPWHYLLLYTSHYMLWHSCCAFSILPSIKLSMNLGYWILILNSVLKAENFTINEHIPSMHYRIIYIRAHVETINFCKMDKCSNLPHVKHELSTYPSSMVGRCFTIYKKLSHTFTIMITVSVRHFTCSKFSHIFLN